MTVSTNPGGIYLTFRIADSAGQYFTLNSVSIDISVNGILASTETYDSYILASNWNRIGVYATNSYGIGLMNQGPILVGFGDRNSTAAYSVNLNPGDVWQAKVSYDVQGLGVVTSIGTVSRIPEPSIFCCLGVSIFGLLRRRR
ncbi:MAG: PEP-CTERM sorting domain-containing protein [bacterium]